MKIMINKLLKEEEEFWENLKKEIISETDFLIKNHRDALALKNILCAIDALAGLFVGREKNNVERSWFSYIDRVMKETKKVNIKKMGLYFPNLSLDSFHRSERATQNRKKKNIENCCMLLYPIYRNSVIHNGVLPSSFFITRQKTNDNVWLIENTNSDYKIGLNILELFSALKDSIHRFEKSFNNDKERIKNFRKRYDFLKNNYILKKN